MRWLVFATKKKKNPLYNVSSYADIRVDLIRECNLQICIRTFGFYSIESKGRCDK